MPWLRFTANFDWKPKPQVTIAFKAGQEKNVPTPCAEAALAKGVAVRLPRKRRTDGDLDQGA